MAKEQQDILIQPEQEDFELLGKFDNEFLYSLPFGVCLINTKRKIIDINQEAENVTGYTLPELIDRDIDFLLKPVNTIKSIIYQATQKNKVEGKKLMLLTKERKQVAAKITVITLKNSLNKIIGFFLIILKFPEEKDIQELYEQKMNLRTKDLEEARIVLIDMLEDAEEARKKIQEEQNKTRATLISVNVGLIVFDHENKVSLVNPKAQQILGIKEKDVINKNIEKILNFPCVKKLYETIGKKIRFTDKNFELDLSDYEDRYYRVTFSQAKARGEKFGLILVLNDITRDKFIDKVKSEFINIAAHQLRTPLSAIKWAVSETLKEKGSLSEEQEDLLDKAYLSNERMIGLVDDMLNISRIEEGRFGYIFSKCDCDRILGVVLKNSEDRIKEKNIKIKVDKPKKMPTVYIDEKKMIMAVQNILDNAVHYTPENGKIEIKARVKEDYLVVSIKDNGVGIPQAEQSKLFTKFFRGSNVVRMQTEGSGLGLFITKNIIERHGGTIKINSKEGIGTKVIFTLPIKK